MHYTNLGNVVDEFIAWVNRTANPAVTPVFSYLAAKHEDGELALVKGALALNRTQPFQVREEYGVENIIAGYFEVEHENLIEFCTALVEGVVQAPGGRNMRMVNADQRGVDRIELSSEDAGTDYQQNRPAIYKLIGGLHRFPLAVDTNWKLKAGLPPYDSILDLSADYQFGPITESSTVDVISLIVTAIDNQSAINGIGANIRIRLQKGLDPEVCNLAYRAIAANRSVRRRAVIAGQDMTWTAENDLQIGTAMFSVEAGDVLNCYAIYDSRAQHQFWVGDPKNTQNPRRAAYETYDPSLERLQIWLRGAGKKKQDDFEFAVSTLGWLLGFAALHFERDSITESPDILLVAHSAVLVIECTVAAFAGDKVAKLRARADTILQRLNASGHPALAVHSIMVSCVDGDAADASSRITREHGVALIAADALASLLGRTVLFPNAEDLVREWTQAVDGAQ